VTSSVADAGAVALVNATMYDLSKPTPLRAVIFNVSDSNSTGFNHVYCYRGPTSERLAARFVQVHIL